MTEPTNENASDNGAPGELLPRFGARLIDGLILSIPGFAFGRMLGPSVTWLVVSTVGTYAYFVLLDTYWGATIGKRLLRLRVTGPDGALPTMTQAAVREAFNLVGGIPFLGFPLSLVVQVIIAVTISRSPTRQGKHDELAGGTRVVAT